MKKYISHFLALSLSVMVVPAIPVYISGRAVRDEKKSAESDMIPAEEDTGVQKKAETEKKEEKEEVAAEFSGEPYKVLDMASGQVIEVPVRDYIIGAVCAEMPASFHDEALKAQAVAALAAAPATTYLAVFSALFGISLLFSLTCSRSS